jgi:ferric-dicitrate binding protein FerR (iron transport regulator)
MDLFKILHKIQAGEELLQAERDFLAALFLTKDGKLRFMKMVESRWDDFETDRTDLDFNPDKLLEKVRQRINAEKTKKRFTLPLYVRYSLEFAAAVALVFVCSLFLKDKTMPTVVTQAPPVEVEIYNPKGIRTTITLPDSSKVILNGDTRIAYAYNFEETARIVKLEGEAYFEVHRDETRPFLVQANEATLTVLGTSFNVRAYPDHNSVDATLVEGSLKVNVGETENLLTPGQQINICESVVIQKVHEVDVYPVKAWVDGKLHIQSMSFTEIAVVLERAFNVNIYIQNEQLKHKKLTGIFDNGENLDQIFQVIQTAVPFKVVYNKEENIFIIK